MGKASWADEGRETYIRQNKKLIFTSAQYLPLYCHPWIKITKFFQVISNEQAKDIEGT